MKQILKRLFSFAMAVMMVLSLVPFNGLEVYAAETNEIRVNSAYNSGTEGFGTTKFANYASAYAYATANNKTATIIIEENSSLSGFTFDNDHKNYSKLAVVVEDGAVMGNALSKWDMTYKVTVLPGGKLEMARPKSSSISNMHIKAALAIGQAGSEEKAYANFLSDTYQDGDMSIRYNGSVTLNNAEMTVQDLDAQGKLTATDSTITVDGAFASDTFFATTLTNSTMTVGGQQISGGLSDFAGGSTNQLGATNLNDSTITFNNGVVTVAGTVTMKGASSVSGKEMVVKSGKKIDMDTTSTLTFEKIENNGTINGTIVVPAGTTTTLSGTGTYGAVNVAEGASLVITGGKFSQDVSAYCPAGYKAVDNGDGTYSVAFDPTYGKVAQIGDTYYETLQAAIDAATAAAGTYEIVLLPGTITENVIIHQTEGVNITIKGNSTDTVFTGHVEIYGHARHNGEETLTFDGVAFTTDVNEHTFIEQTQQTGKADSQAKCYPHNVTVRNCKFVATGAAENTAVGMKYRYGYNILVKDTTSTGLHSLMQNYAGVGLTIDNVNVTGKNGIALGTSQDVSVTNSIINATGYGLRIDAQIADTTTTIANCDITAFVPVVVRKAEKDHNLVVDGNNTMTATNEDGLWCVIGMEEYGDVEKDALTAAAGKIVVTLKDAGLNKAGVYGAYKAPITGTVTPAYTKEVDGFVRVWGEGGGNAEESYVVKLYAGDKLIATTQLNNVGNIIDGDVYVTWNFFYPASNDEYWTTTWEADQPNSIDQPTKVELYLDGVKVAENVAKMSGADDVNPVVWEELGGVKKIVTGLSGAGTETDPYLISCVEELLWFQEKVDEQAADGSTQFAGKYFKLTADIDLAGINWNPIGSMSGDHGSFKGVFDGNGHTIKNLNCQQAGNGQGLFARTAGSAQIKNLTLNNVTVKSTDNSNYVGAVVGNSYASTKITNVHVTGAIDISGRGYIGGISGHGYVVMDNVSVVGEGTISSTFWCAGGILGYGGEGATNIMNAKVEGTGETGLTITSAAGGLGSIVGMAEDNNGTQPISGSNLSAKNINIKTYTGAYGDAYANYALGYLYGGNPTSELTGELKVEDVVITTSNGEAPKAVDVVATVGDAVYFDLQSALDAAQAGETVKLIKNVTLTETVNIPAGKTVILDLNGKTLTGSILAPDAELTVQNGKIVNKDKGVSGIEINAGKLTLTNVDIDSARHALRIDGAVEATINGGTYRGAIGNGTGTYHAVNISGAATVTIEDGTFVGPKGTTSDSGSAVNAQSGSTVIIKGGKFSGGKRNTLSASGTIAVSGGIFDQTVAEKYCVEGYICVDNGDGTYSVERGLRGSGTQEDPFLIKTLDDLILFRDSVNAGKTKYNAPGVYVALDADIDLAGIDWSVNIGDDCNATFDGIFDGKNHKISNLTSTETAQKADGYICTGLFGAIYGSAQIKNLTIENVTINADYKGNNVGAVVGFAYACTDAVIENVKVIGNVNINAPQAYGVGAIVGYAYYGNSLTIKDCSVEGTTGSAITASSASSGIIGYSSNYGLTVEGCTVKDVALNATAIAGGLAGVITGGTFTDNTVENVTITVTGENWKNSAAVAVGTLASTSVTVSDTTYSNVNVTAIVGSQYAEQPTTPVGKVQAKIGDTYYYDFNAAFKAAKTGDEIVLLAPIVVNKGEVLTLDKDVTITYTSDVVGEDMITVRGTLNVASGKITYTNNSNGSNVTVSTISAEPGSVVNVTGGTIENKSVAPSGSSSYAYAIDMLTNGSLGDVTVTISGGTVYSDYMAIRQFNNGTACKNALTVTGGKIYGAKRAIQIHMDNDAAVLAISGGVIEAGEGGYALCLFPKTSTNIAVSGGKFIGTVYSGTNGIITGGTFTEPVEEAYCAAGYICVENGDGTYSVKEGQYVAEVNGKKYESLTKAINAAVAGQTITLLADVNENVTVNKNLTIDGAGKNYTGKMTLNKVNVTIENVNFVKGTVYKNKNTGAGGNYTIKDCTFDGQGLSDYAINLGGTNNIVIENVTAKDYGYGLLQVPSSNVSLTVKNVEVRGCDYGFKVDYSNGVTMENVTVVGSDYGIYDSNHGTKTYTIKNSNISSIKIWERSAAKTTTFKFEGINEVAAMTTSQYAVVKGATIEGTNYYGSIQPLVEKAENGQTVKLLSDLTLTDADIQMVGSHKVMINVEGKNITLDMNGKKITVNYTGGAHLIAPIRVADGAGLTVTGNGSIDVPTNGINVAYMFWKAGSTGHLTIENGTYHMDNSADSMVYTNGDEIVTVKGGNWAIDQIGTRENGFPCIFNAQGSGDRSIIVTGGTFNADINHQHWGNEAVVDKTCYVVDNGDGTWTVKPGAVAYVDLGTLTGPYFVAKDFGFATLEEAFAAADDGNTITLLADIELTAGVTVPADKTITLDLNGFDIIGKPNEAKAFSVINNKGDLTIEGSGSVVCDHQLAGSTGYAVNTITNSGTLTIDGATIENKSTAAYQIGYAIDNNSTTGDAVLVIKNGEVKASGSNYYDGIRQFCNSLTNENAVTVEGGAVSSIWLQNPSDGTVEKDQKDVKGSVSITDGTVNALYLEPSAAFDAEITGGYVGKVEYFTTSEGRDLIQFITGGTFGMDVTAYCALGYQAVANTGGTYTVARNESIVAWNMQTGAQYETVMGALLAAEENETVQLIKDSNEANAVLTVLNGITLDLNGHTLTAYYAMTATVGSYIIDSTDGQGLLKVAKNNLVLADNTQLKIWKEEENGYRFAAVSFKTNLASSEAGKATFMFYLNEANGAVMEELADGAEDNDGLYVQVRMTYTNSQGGRSVLYFDFPADKVVEYAEKEYNSKASYLFMTIAGLDTVTNVSFEAVVGSGSIMLASAAASYNG